jgi:hypothetical protein
VIRKNANLEGQKPAHALGLVIETRTREMGLNPRQLSMMIPSADNTEGHMAYDTIRKIHNGETFPSDPTLVKICGVLGLDIEELREVSRKARLEAKGGIAIEESLVDPIILSLNKTFRHLTQEQKEFIQFEARQFAKENISVIPQTKKKLSEGELMFA